MFSTNFQRLFLGVLVFVARCCANTGVKMNSGKQILSCSFSSPFESEDNIWHVGRQLGKGYYSTWYEVIRYGKTSKNIHLGAMNVLTWLDPLQVHVFEMEFSMMKELQEFPFVPIVAANEELRELHVHCENSIFPSKFFIMGLVGKTFDELAHDKSLLAKLLKSVKKLVPDIVRLGEKGFVHKHLTPDSIAIGSGETETNDWGKVYLLELERVRYAAAGGWVTGGNPVYSTIDGGSNLMQAYQHKKCHDLESLFWSAVAIILRSSHPSTWGQSKDLIRFTRWIKELREGNLHERLLDWDVPDRMELTGMGQSNWNVLKDYLVGSEWDESDDSWDYKVLWQAKSQLLEKTKFVLACSVITLMGNTRTIRLPVLQSWTFTQLDEMISEFSEGNLKEIQYYVNEIQHTYDYKNSSVVKLEITWAVRHIRFTMGKIDLCLWSTRRLNKDNTCDENAPKRRSMFATVLLAILIPAAVICFGLLGLWIYRRNVAKEAAEEDVELALGPPIDYPPHMAGVGYADDIREDLETDVETRSSLKRGIH